MLHAHHFLNYVRKTSQEYVMFTLLFLTTQICIWRKYSYEESSVIAASLLIVFVFVLFFKSLARRIFYVLMVPSSDYKHTEWTTLSFIFYVLCASIVLLGFMMNGTVIQLLGFSSSSFHIIYNSGFIASLLIPTLISESAFHQFSSSVLIFLFRLTTPLLFVSALVFPLLYSDDPVMILQLFILAAAIRMFVFLIILIDLQLIDFFSVTVVRLKNAFWQFVQTASYDAFYWLGLIIIFCSAFINVSREYQIFLTISVSFFVIIPIVASQIMEQWTLLFKNFIRLDLSGQFIDFVKYMNIWLAVILLGISPFIFLISDQSVQWLMHDIPMTIKENFIMTVIMMMFTGFYLSNPLKEIIVMFNRKREMNSVLFSSFIASMGSCYVFALLLGSVGVIFSFIIGAFIYWIGINIIIQPLLACDFKYIFPYRSFFLIILSTIVSFFTAYSMDFIPNSLFHQVGWKFFSYFCLYIVLITYFGILKTDQSSGFLNWTRRLGNLH